MKTEFDIIIIGPPTDKYIREIDGQPHILNTQKTMYPAEELEKIAPFFTGRGCYEGHSGSQETGGSFFRFSPKVGNIVKSYWDSERLSICGTLHVKSEAWLWNFNNYPLEDYHFSAELSNFKLAYGRWKIVYLSLVYSVDLVDFGAAGGRFDVPRPARLQKIYNDILRKIEQ